jgi:hypothetical protein
MSLPLTINQKETTLPLSWNELTLAQYARLYNAVKEEKDTLGIIAALLDVDKQTLLDAPAGQIDATLFNNIQWINQLPTNLTAEHCPKELSIGNKKYTVPQSFDNLKFGQVLLFQSAIASALDATLNTINPDVYPQLLAIVFAVDEAATFDENLIAALVEQAKQCPFVEAMPVLNFFLSCLASLNNAKPAHLNAKPAQKNRKRALAALKILMPTHWLGWLWMQKTLRITKP